MVGPKVAQGDVYWYDFAEPRGSEPRFERPVAILTAGLGGSFIDEVAAIVARIE